MKALSAIAIAAAMAMSMTSCKFISITATGLKNMEKASDNYITKAYEVSDFNDIYVNVPCKLVYVPGSPFMDINCPDNLPERLEVECADGKLSITVDKSQKLRNLKDVTITVSSSKINNIQVDGAMNLETPRGITTDRFTATFNGATESEIKPLKCDSAEINVNGAADLNLEDVDCGSLRIQVNGAGDCQIEGKADSAHIEVNGAGDIDVRKLKCDNLISSVRGAGKVRKK